MADSAKSEANFRINIGGNAADATKDVAASARLAARAIGAYEDEVKQLSGDLRRLRGNSDEVNAAKKQLKDRIDRARASISSLTVELNKQGTSYATAAAAAQKYGAGIGAKVTVAAQGAATKIAGFSKNAARSVGGALGKAAAPVAAKLGAALQPAAKKLASTLAPAAKKIGTALAPLGKKVGAAVAPAGKAIARLGTGATKSIKVIALGAKEAAGKALPSLSSALTVVGAGAVTATVAIAAAAVAAAAGAAAFVGLGIASAAAAQKMNRQRQALLGNADDAGRLGDQITRLASKVPQGVDEINALGVELSKTRLPGKALVDTMNAIAQASGAVDASAGAKIQEIITRGQHTGRMFLGQLELQGTGIDFDDVAREYAAGTRKSIAAARQELLMGAVPLERGAEAIRKATEKKFGDLNLKNSFSLENAPKKFFEQFKSLTAGVNFEPLTKGLQDAFGQLSPEAPLGRAVKTFFEGFGSDVVAIAAKGIPVLLEGFKWLMVGALRVGAFFYEMKKQIKDAFDADGWVGVGKEVVLGFVKGITGLHGFAIEAITSLAKDVVKAFRGPQGIDAHSPSKKFEASADDAVDGWVKGAVNGSRRAQTATINMVAAPEPARASSGGGFGGGDIHLHFHGGPAPDPVAMQSAPFLAAITRAVRDAANQKGLAAA